METPAPDPIPDDLILAAIERAERHNERRGAAMSAICEHLGLSRRSGAARKVRARVLAMTQAGVLEQLRRSGVKFWTLSDEGRKRLERAKGTADMLPESPQHQAWSNARTLAEREMLWFRERLRAVIAEATILLDAPASAMSSDEWLKLGQRLDRHVRRVSAATHCLYEWPEPSEDVADISAARTLGKRSYQAWKTVDAEDAKEYEAQSRSAPVVRARRRPPRPR